MSKRFQRGSVFAVGNKWHGRYWRDVPGKETREHPLVVLGERKEMTKLEARKKLADIIEKEGLNKETYLEISVVPAVTFNHVADAWELTRLPQLALSTRHDAPGQIAKHLRPFFGALPLESIKTGTINEWVMGLVKIGLEPKTIHNQWKTFRAIMNWHAQQNDEPERTWYPSLPHIPDTQARWYTVDEMMRIIEVSAEYPGRGIAKGQYKPLFHLTAFSGLRSGEISGLHVEDLDFVRGVIHVQRSIFDGVEVETKGKRRRDVFVDSITLRMLKEYLGDRKAGRVFQSRNGTPIRNGQLVTVLHWAAKRLGIKPGGMHAWRHGRVSLMRANGVPLNIIQDQVGHQDKRTTDIYTHNEEAFIRDTMNRLAFSCTQRQNLYTDEGPLRGTK
jgi:integrase